MKQNPHNLHLTLLYCHLTWILGLRKLEAIAYRSLGEGLEKNRRVLLREKTRSPIKHGFGVVGMLSGLGIFGGGINRGWSAIRNLTTWISADARAF
jgi:hypothetical protein